jgi:mannosylglycerate hydrolase
VIPEPRELDPEQGAAGSRPRSFFVVPHTHWDREWYRPFEHFRLELARVVDGVIDVLERNPGFASFTLDGQAIVLEDYVEVRPENEGRLRALLTAGRIEVGPGYVLPDELLVGAESLVRNLLVGQAVCERFGAAPSPVGYLPDSFGHPLQLPQVLAGFGIDSFLFSRGLGDELDDLGVVFRWRAPDGSEVFAFQLLPHYDNFARVESVEDAQTRIRVIVERFGPALERAGVHDLLLCNGSDHLPVQPELPALCAELEQCLPGARFVIAGYGDYVRAVEPVEVPAWTGELLGSRLQNVLRGVNSARLYLKQANQVAERRLLAVETLAALRVLQDGEPFPTSDFRLAWRELLRCQPHDSICGCSCDEVHRDMLVRYESLDRTLSELQDRALSGFAPASSATSIGVVNTLPYRRRALIEPPGAEPVLIELGGFAARTVELPPASPAYSLRASPADSPGRPPAAAIESERFRVEATAGGTLTLLDKRSGRQFEQLHALEDEPDMGDLYNFCPVDGSPVWTSESATVRVVARGPLVWELEVQVEIELPAGLDPAYRALREIVRLSASTVVRLVRGSSRVEFRTTIDNPARDHRLRAVFPAGTVAGPVRAEAQFAVVQRPLVPAQPRTDWAEPPDPTQHTLGAAALGPLALLTKGLPEYEARSDHDRGELCLTLLRCVGVISRPAGVLVTRPRSAGPQLQTPGGQCLGRHELEYALLADADTLDDAALLREAHDYRCGFLTGPGGVRFDPPVTLDGDVVFSCLKGAEDGDGLILRCFNPAASQATARLAGPVTLSLTRLDETREQPLPDGILQLRPGQIATLRLRNAGDPGQS